MSEINHLLSHRGLGTPTLRKTNHKSPLHQHARLLSCTVLIACVLVGEGGLTPLALVGESSTLERPVSTQPQRLPLVLCPRGTEGTTERRPKEKATFLEGTARKLKMRPYCFQMVAFQRHGFYLPNCLKTSHSKSVPWNPGNVSLYCPQHMPAFTAAEMWAYSCIPKINRDHSRYTQPCTRGCNCLRGQLWRTRGT